MESTIKHHSIVLRSMCGVLTKQIDILDSEEERKETDSERVSCVQLRKETIVKTATMEENQMNKTLTKRSKNSCFLERAEARSVEENNR